MARSSPLWKFWPSLDIKQGDDAYLLTAYTDDVTKVYLFQFLLLVDFRPNVNILDPAQ